MTHLFEAEVIIGIEDIVITELQAVSGIDSSSIVVIREGFIRFNYKGSLAELNRLQSIIAIYKVHHFYTPRPKAILGHQNFTRLCNLITENIESWQRQTPISFGIGAAGSDSSVFKRIKQEISQATGLPLAEDEKGELFIRFTKAKTQTGWEILIRTTPHPLSKRQWRKENVPGALNATVAYAMTTFADIRDKSRIINLCSGTGTLLIEQLLSTTRRPHTYGIDNDISMHNRASINIPPNQISDTISLVLGDATQTPFQDEAFDVLYADLPFGHHIGSHDTNEWLYPAILSESARIATIDGIFIAITHEIQLFEQSVQISDWFISHQRQINLSGLHPKIFVLERN